MFLLWLALGGVLAASQLEAVHAIYWSRRGQRQCDQVFCLEIATGKEVTRRHSRYHCDAHASESLLAGGVNLGASCCLCFLGPASLLALIWTCAVAVHDLRRRGPAPSDQKARHPAP